MTETETAPDRNPATQIASETAPESLKEVEIKFLAGTEGIAAALASPLLQDADAKGPAKKLVSTYFDTPDWDLQAHRMVLRIRRSGRATPVMTVKWVPEQDEGVFVRGEIEVAAKGGAPHLDLILGPVGDKLRALVGDKVLEPKYETRVSRTIRNIVAGAAKIETAFDRGVIVAGEKTRDLSEIELELKSGPLGDFDDFAALLAVELSLRLDIVSKSERAYHLAHGTGPKPVKAKASAASPGLRLDDDIARVILSARDHFVANWAALREGDDPEAIHQMRVALRRLRAVLAMFKRAVPCAEFEIFRTEAKELASAMGGARDCDALRELIETGPAPHFAGTDAFAPLFATLDARREAEYAGARALLDSPRPTLFALRLGAFVARRGWRNALNGDQLAVVTEPVELFAAQALERLHKRVLKRGKNLADLPDEARHEARIAMKNLRYGADFFGAAFDDPRGLAAFLRATSQVQELLGAHNDAASAAAFLNADHSAETARAAGLLMGWCARGAVQADAKLAKAWKNFRKAKPFWG